MFHNTQPAVQKNFSTDIFSARNIFFALAFASLCFWYMLSEKNGWGEYYVGIAQNFGSMLVRGEIPKLDLQRTFPLVIVWLTHKLFAIPTTFANTISLFSFWNACYVALSFFFFHRIALSFNLRKTYYWAAFICVYLNFFILKQTAYYPATTDALAFLLGLAMYSFYLRDNRAALALTIFISAFTWPSGYMSGLILLLLPQRFSLAFPFGRKSLFYWLAMLFAFVLSLRLFYWLIFDGAAETFYAAKINRQLLPISVAAICCYLLFVVHTVLRTYLFRGKQRFVHLRVFITSFVLLITVIVVRSYLLRRFSQPAGRELEDTFEQMIRGIFSWTIINPGHFFVSHFIYWGLPVLLTVMALKRISLRVQRFGLGLLLHTGFTFIFLVNCETRHLVFHLPFYFLVMVSLSRPYFSGLWLTGLALVQFVFSKVWLKMDIEWNSPFYLANVKGADSPILLQYPYQKYFLNFGPWLSESNYLIGCIVLFCFLFFTILTVLQRRRDRIFF